MTKKTRLKKHKNTFASINRKRVTTTNFCGVNSPSIRNPFMQAEKVDVNSTLFNYSFISPSGEMSWLFSSSCLREDVMTGGISAQLLEPLDSRGLPAPGAVCF